MEGLATTWPCVVQRRMRRDWFYPAESVSAEPKKASYDYDDAPRRYARHRAKREIDRQRKEHISIIARLLTNEIDVKERFNALADEWEKETSSTSSVTAITSHQKYREIIKLGWDIVPSLLIDLQENQRFWFTALYEITGIRPFDPSDAGNSKRMTEAWVKWGQNKKLINPCNRH
jgi:hypothetical protein